MAFLTNEKLSELIEQYLNSCKKENLDKKTLKAYSIDLQHFARVSPEYEFYEKENIRNYIEKLHVRYESASTVRRKIASLKAFLYYLMTNGIIETRNLEELKDISSKWKPNYDIIQQAELYLFYEELAREYKRAEDDKKRKKALRNIAIVEILFSTGIKISELCQLQPENIDIENCKLRIKNSKGKLRTVKLDSVSVIAVLDKYIQDCADEIKESASLFFNGQGNGVSEQVIRRMICNVADKAGIKAHITPSKFRNAYIRQALEMGMDMYSMQENLGNRSVSCLVERYLQVFNGNSVQRRTNPRDLLLDSII